MPRNLPLRLAAVVVLALVCPWCSTWPTATAAEAVSLAIYPQAISLHGSQARQLLLVERVVDSLVVGQAEGVSFTVADPAIAELSGDYLIPKANGTTTVTATLQGLSAQVPVTVTGLEAPFAWSFRNHVESVFAKAGCSSGACHGALAGKNGFRLSLRGYDPAGDYSNIIRQSRGRRVVLGDPGKSLLLTKPSGAIRHGGGVRLDVTSRDYQVLAEWLAQGAPAPQSSDPKLVKLEILPPAATLKLGAQHQLLVLAHFSDGHQEDVTQWAKYTSTDETVAQVTEGGVAKIMGRGEGAITAWYLSQVVAGTLSVPYESEIPAETFAQAPRRNFIDDLILEKMQALKIPPSPRASDEEFLRRTFVDTLGVLPSAQESRDFLADASSDKRDRLIETLLNRPEYVDYWSYKWSDLLLVNSERLQPAAMWSYYRWIRYHVAANTPWDEFARGLLTAKGSTLENGAANYFILHEDPLDLAETTSMAFLGMSIGCAKCHNHPLEKWTNDQYYGMANLFARVRFKSGSTAGENIVFAADQGELIQPLTGKPQPPAPLDAAPLDMHDAGDRLAHLADWLAAPENPYFTRAITNRVFANFFGRGLVESVDDLRATNPASNEKLLSALAQHLVENKYDLKALVRVILQSETYQRSSQAVPGNVEDLRYFSHYYPKRMMAEVLLDSLSQVTEAATQFPGYPAGSRAMQLPDSRVESYFLRSFGRPERVITCECERNDEPTMVQVLHVWNGDGINQKLQTAGNRIDRLLQAGADARLIVEDLFLAALSRFPTAEESAQLQAAMAALPEAERRIGYEDLFWSVLSSKEFLFNH